MSPVGKAVKTALTFFTLVFMDNVLANTCLFTQAVDMELNQHTYMFLA